MYNGPAKANLGQQEVALYGLPAGTTVYLYVKSTAGGKGSPKSTINVFDTPKAAPENLRADSVRAHGVRLDWDRSTTSSHTYYEAYRDTEPRMTGKTLALHGTDVLGEQPVFLGVIERKVFDAASGALDDAPLTAAQVSSIRYSLFKKEEVFTATFNKTEERIQVAGFQNVAIPTTAIIAPRTFSDSVYAMHKVGWEDICYKIWSRRWVNDRTDQNKYPSAVGSFVLYTGDGINMEVARRGDPDPFPCPESPQRYELVSEALWHGSGIWTYEDFLKITDEDQTSRNVHVPGFRTFFHSGSASSSMHTHEYDHLIFSAYFTDEEATDPFAVDGFGRYAGLAQTQDAGETWVYSDGCIEFDDRGAVPGGGPLAQKVSPLINLDAVSPEFRHLLFEEGGQWA